MTLPWRGREKMSFMKRLKRRGPNMEPCGTPEVNMRGELLIPEISTT
jgi:hypothetical protein